MIRSYHQDQERLLLAVDCIIFGFDDQKLKILLVKRDIEPELGKWSLMGGFVQKVESIDEAAIRILYRWTGLTNIYMEQLYCFGEVGRDPVERVVSVAYFALINIQNYDQELQKKHNAHWFPVEELPELIFDHAQMVEEARKKLKYKASIQPVGFALLPQKFTLPQLQTLYEAIFATSLDKGNFRRRIQSLGVLKKLNEKQKGFSKKGAYYYVFDERKYKELEKNGINFVIK
jgi:ADP-ribose pyrophosphatase YjhB (NUDIX family)